MQNTESHWRWQDGVVDSRKEHIELRAGDARKSLYEDWQPIARLGSRSRLREESVRDHLTGLFNRRYLEETLERELLRASRRQATVGIIMLDMDDLKRFNDVHGHTAGDLVLCELGALLLQHVRGEDIPCPYGGEEFIIFLPDASREVTRQCADLAYEKARGFAIQFEGKSLHAVTLSMGLATFPENGSTAAVVLKAADAALYRANREGNGKLVLAEPLSAADPTAMRLEE